MRLSPELIEEIAEQRVDPNQDRSLVLRGFRISQIENLGITRNQYACIDLSDNEISRIENFPSLSNLRTLIIASNGVSQIAHDAFDGLTGLTSLVLSNNRIAKLGTLNPIQVLVNLERLSLIDNPVTKTKHYRYFVIHLMQYSTNLRFLDFQRITDAERVAAKTFFETSEGTGMLNQIRPVVDEPVVASVIPAERKLAFGPEILSKLRDAITSATDMQTVTKLERALQTGELSEDVASILGIS
jgi:U2 small nuclear ribonucleoprotein A'